MNSRQAYEWLLAHQRESSYISSATAVLAWDQRTYMPRGGATHRTEQMATFARILHQRSSDPRIEEHLSTIEQSELVNDPLSDEAVNVKEWRRVYDRTKKVPEKLAVALARAASDGETVWETARPANDWKTLEPKLELLLELLKERASAVGFANEAYDALLEDYEPGMTAKDLVPVFGGLRTYLVGLLGRINESSIKADPSIIKRHFPIDSQEAFAKEMVAKLGYKFEHGRLDISAHPFSISIGPGDSRITTRYMENFFNSAFFGTAHEAGHGMYEQGLDPEHWGTPRGEAVSLGVHESQSRMWENMVCRSFDFWQYAFPLAQERFEALKGVSLDEFLLAVNNVEPSLIRVEADEVTYNLHIAIRFELELELMRGNLPISELPGAWDAKMLEYFGIKPSNFADGVMQDVHWPGGGFGYFPTYTLGNLYAAQLLSAAKRDLGDLGDSFAKGEFQGLREWLRSNIHSKGCTYSPKDLVNNVTGKYPDSTALIEYCEEKFTRLYGL